MCGLINAGGGKIQEGVQCVLMKMGFSKSLWMKSCN